MKEVEKALADQKVSGRRIVIEEVEGSEDEEPLSAAGPGSSHSAESRDNHAQETANNTDVSQTREVLIDKTKDHDSQESCRNVNGAGDAGVARTEGVSQSQVITDKGDMAPPDDNMPPAVLALKDAGNDLFRKGQYADALDKYNAAVQLLGWYLVLLAFRHTAVELLFYSHPGLAVCPLDC